MIQTSLKRNHNKISQIIWSQEDNEIKQANTNHLTVHMSTDD